MVNDFLSSLYVGEPQVFVYLPPLTMTGESRVKVVYMTEVILYYVGNWQQNQRHKLDEQSFMNILGGC